ncbi:hypothetical protein H6F77_11655 [Microcoleus sp. FACHB-831]|uniref:hypothetical protein n=1 Tax=Microcoleus sp. FACHB-831 TaxID=2692827 RepID=UPI0016857640|nr:hypothetical protein [Microcoleus sp. FACHB-831]MBD1921747.1 hypothetical protein [Microcoleus sp. FACHB-831]
MPRRRNRFADLERMLRQSGGIAAAGSRVGNFAAFKAGTRKIKITQKPTAADKVRVTFGLLPFNSHVPETVTDADRYIGVITAGSLAMAKSGGLAKTDLGLDETKDATVLEENYYPALVRAFFAESATVAAIEKTSDITGDKYMKVPGKSMSAPFGRTIAALDAKKGSATASLVNSEEEDVKKHVQAILKDDKKGTLGAARSVSYDPEVFRGRTKVLTRGVF